MTASMPFDQSQPLTVLGRKIYNCRCERRWTLTTLLDFEAQAASRQATVR
jgi:hypothetical protein